MKKLSYARAALPAETKASKTTMQAVPAAVRTYLMSAYSPSFARLLLQSSFGVGNVAVYLLVRCQYLG